MEYKILFSAPPWRRRPDQSLSFWTSTVFLPGPMPMLMKSSHDNEGDKGFSKFCYHSIPQNETTVIQIFLQIPCSYPSISFKSVTFSCVFSIFSTRFCIPFRVACNEVISCFIVSINSFNGSLSSFIPLSRFGRVRFPSPISLSVSLKDKKPRGYPLKYEMSK